jgi:accessory gene regulator B
MITKLSIALTRILLKRSIVSADDEELYAYGFFMIISYLIFFFVALSIGFILRIPIESIVFYMTFCAIRNYAGGIHANTETKCTVFTTISIAVSLILIKLLVTYKLIITSSVIMVTAGICLFAFAPLSNEQKEIDKNERLRFRRITRLCTIVAIVAVSLTFICKVCCNIGFAISIGMMLSAVLLAIGECQKYLNQIKNEIEITDKGK